MLQPTVLDAFIAGLSTAFFGSLVASGAYLLRQQLALREAMATLAGRVDRLRALEKAVQSIDLEEAEILKSPGRQGGGDAGAQ